MCNSDIVNKGISSVLSEFLVYLTFQGHPTDRFGKLDLFERPSIASDFLKRIATSKFRDMRNFMFVVFGVLKMSFWVPKKDQLSDHLRKGDKT